MIQRQWFFALLMLACSAALEASETDEKEIFDSIQPFSICAPASSHAQKVLDYVTQQLNYQGEKITLCRATSIPSLAAWSKLVGMKQHPYVSWKKEPVTAPYISYNPLFMEQLEQAQGEVIAYALMARQVGHHIKLHTDYQTPLAGLDPNPAQVAIADFYAGYFLAKQELSPEHLGAIQQTIFSLTEYPEASILAQRQRLLLQGWEQGGGSITQLPELIINQLW